MDVCVYVCICICISELMTKHTPNQINKRYNLMTKKRMKK